MSNTQEEAAQPELSPNTYFTFQTLTTDEGCRDEERLFALRYQVYCQERFFLPAENYPDKLEKDEYDAYSIQIAAYSINTNILVGSLRLVTPPVGKCFPFQKHCRQLFADKKHPPRQECAEISRLVISKLYRRRADDTVYGASAQLTADAGAPQIVYDRRQEKRDDSDRRKLQPQILLGMLRQAYQQSKRNGIHHLYMALEKPLARLLHRLFYFSLEPIGEQADYYGPVVPCILPIVNFEEALSHGDPLLFAWFQEAIKETGGPSASAASPSVNTLPAPRTYQ